MDDINSSPNALVTETLKAAPTSDSPGWKTTEFWLHVLTILGIIGTSLAGAGLPARYAAVCLVVSTSAYSVARGLAKMGNSN